MINLPKLRGMSKLTNLLQKVLGSKKSSAQEAKERLKALKEPALPQEIKKAA